MSSTPCARTPASTSRSAPNGSNASWAAASTGSSPTHRAPRGPHRRGRGRPRRRRGPHPRPDRAHARRAPHRAPLDRRALRARRPGAVVRAAVWRKLAPGERDARRVASTAVSVTAWLAVTVPRRPGMKGEELRLREMSGHELHTSARVPPASCAFRVTSNVDGPKTRLYVQFSARQPRLPPEVAWRQPSHGR